MVVIAVAPAWGDVPTWIAGIAAVAALVAAAMAAHQTKSLLVIEQARDDRVEQAEIRKQALQVSAWATGHAPEIEPEGGPGICSPSVGALVFNGSPLPIYRVHIVVWWQNTEIKTGTIDMLPPGKSWIADLDPYEFDQIVGNAHASAVVTGWTSVREWEATAAQRLRVEVSFRDADNRSWTRDRDGVLSPRD